jgi:hypothetical protein
MDREQAVNIIKEIFENCNAIEGKSLKLLPPQENNTLSNTFQIHIDVNGNSEIISCIQVIVQKHNLLVKVKDRWLTVYKPYPNLNEP